MAAIGRARARRYTALVSVAASEHILREEPARYATRRDWLTPEGKEVRDLVGRSLVERQPVGYRSAFLAAYEPNVTFYLPMELRRNLAEIGHVGMGDLPAGTYVRQLMNRLMIDLSWNSSRLEGNTYSLLETQRLLEEGVGVEGRGLAETQMILNHKAAIEMLAEQAEEIGFNRYTICNLHALLADISRRANERLPAEQRALFIEAVENSLGSLHEGNIARFRLRTSVFSQWKRQW